MRDIERTILSQYANSPSLCAMIAGWNLALDPTSLLDRWYDLVWNMRTAQGFGLDVWGRIVGVSRVLSISSETYLGFAEANDLTEDGFSTAPWYTGRATTTNFALADEGYRQLIYAKALANIADCSVLSLNLIAMTLFAGQGDVWVRDNGDMTMTYIFDFVPTDVQISIIQNSGVLPRPAGVGVSYAIRSEG
ncbi:MAG: DUF2612 domain-containing protein [Acetobacter sp.]|uniref:DUF2612 domain-containing protein n=1 Tax=Acetobacter sp. TaxID=440 RepID=UPI0039EB2D7F